MLPTPLEPSELRGLCLPELRDLGLELPEIPDTAVLGSLILEAPETAVLGSLILEAPEFGGAGGATIEGGASGIGLPTILPPSGGLKG